MQAFSKWKPVFSRGPSPSGRGCREERVNEFRDGGKTRANPLIFAYWLASFSSVPKFVHTFEAAGEDENGPSSGPSGHLLPEGEGSIEAPGQFFVGREFNDHRLTGLERRLGFILRILLIKLFTDVLELFLFDDAGVALKHNSTKTIP